MNKPEFPHNSIVAAILDSFPDEKCVMHLELDHTLIVFPDEPLNDGSLIYRIEGHNADELAMLARIQAFVETLIKTNKSPYKQVPNTRGELCYQSEAWFKYSKLFHELVHAQDTGYNYPIETRVFLAEVKAMQLDHLLMAETPNNQYLVTIDNVRHCKASLINLLAQRILKTMQTPAMVRKRKEQREAIATNFMSNARYLHDLLLHYSRLEVGRMDLGYTKAYAGSITLEQIKADLARMLKNRRKNRIFRNLVGYCWKLEYGIKKGYHIHMILFFNNVKLDSGAQHVQQIGNYWCQDITQGMGCYYNCNLARSKYRHWGIGTLNYHDTDKIGILLRCIQYLCKLEQFPIHHQLGGSVRKIDHGRAPRIAKAPQGRKRKHALEWDHIIASLANVECRYKARLTSRGVL